MSLSRRSRAWLGYATIAACHLDGQQLRQAGRSLPRLLLPALRLGRLAVHEDHRGEGIGRDLMRTTFVAAKKMADDVGCVGVLVDAYPTAVAFYEQWGFEPCNALEGGEPGTTLLFLELNSVA